MTNTVCPPAIVACFPPRRRTRRCSGAEREDAFPRGAVCAASPRAVRTHGLPVRVVPRSRVPALSRWPGHMPAHKARCRARGQRCLSGPLSARITCARRRVMPGRVSRLVSGASSGRAVCVDHDPVARRARPLHCLPEQIVRGTPGPWDEVYQHGGICFLSNDRREHLAGGLAHRITCDRRERARGLFHIRVPASDRAGTVFADASPRAGTFAPFPLESRRDNARATQAMQHHLGDPFSIGSVGLASGDSVEVLRMDDEHVPLPFPSVNDGFPEAVRPFQSTRGHVPALKPRTHPQQIGPHRANDPRAGDGPCAGVG
jgi:hypothetical protein